MGCTKHCSEFLPALWAKSNVLLCMGGSANIHIFIEELMQEKTSECRRGGEGMMLPAEDGKLSPPLYCPLLPLPPVFQMSGARVLPPAKCDGSPLSPQLLALSSKGNAKGRMEQRKM